MPRERLDIFLSHKLADYSRSQIKKWIDAGDVHVNGSSKKGAYKLKAGDFIDILIRPPLEMSAKPQKIPLNIIHEDSDIIVVNKSPYMVVHPAAGNPDKTLVNALLDHCKDLSGIGGVLRPGIVHRLDKGTSGLIIVAKSDKAHTGLSDQFKNREVKKIYLALVYGCPSKQKGEFDQKIGRHPKDRKKMSVRSNQSRDALTRWILKESFEKEISLMSVQLVTGRTHQIRVHFSANGMPLIGDPTYGGKKIAMRLNNKNLLEIIKDVKRPMLHSSSITIRHPISNEILEFSAELPDDFKSVLEKLREIK